MNGINYPSSESGFEVVEDEMGILFGHGSDIRNIVTHDDVAQREIGCWS